MRIELQNTTEIMMKEIADKRCKRKTVAMTYAFALRSSADTDWYKVNTAIIDRWSISALIWIKQQAHSGKCFKEELT